MLKLLGIKRLTPSQEEVFKKLFKNKIDIYTPSITFITIKQKRDFEKRCTEEKIYSYYEINVNYKYKYDYNKIPFLIYLTKEKAKENIRALKNEKKYTIKFSGLNFKKVCRETLNKNIIFNNLIVEAMENEGEDRPKIYIPPKATYWSTKPSKKVNLYKKPSSKTYTFGSKKTGKNDYLKKFNIKDKIGNYYPKLIYLEKKVLIKYLSKVKKIIKAEIKFGKEKVNKIDDKYILENISLFQFNKSKGFIFYFTKSQINKLIEARKDGFNRGKVSIIFSISQLAKTYKEVININSYIHYYKDFERFNQKKSNTPKLLAITNKPHNPQELLYLTENLEKDLIDFGDEEVKDLIDLDTIIPNPPTSTQDLLQDEELFPKKDKKYKVIQNEDLIPSTTNPSTNGVNILKNILNYPETKRLLGISLTSDLKDKIKNLNSEASFGLASILSSLLTTNRGKMSIYSISRNQLKEIIEGFITTLSVLLNPTQKY